MEEKRSEQELVRIAKLEKYKELGLDPFGQRYDAKNKSAQIKEEYKDYTHEQLEEERHEVSVAGRIMFIRKMGKASFFAMQDRAGKIQVYIRKDIVGDAQYDLFKMADIGDNAAMYYEIAASAVELLQQDSVKNGGKVVVKEGP